MVDEAGGIGLADVGGADSGEAVETVETGAEGIESGQEGAESVDNVDTPSKKTDLTDKTATKGKVNLAEVAKKSVEALKAINPALPAAIKAAAFELGGLYREFPDGLREAVAVKQTLSEYGGVEGLKETTAAIKDYGNLESLYEKGDPAFINSLAEASPSSFSKIMPAGLEKWKAIDPEMYNHVQAGVMMQTLDGAKISETLVAVWERLGEDATQKPLKDAIAQIWNKLEEYRKAGEKAPERKVDPQNEALTRREQALAEREQEAFLAPIRNENARTLQTITEREMNQSYQWAATDPDVKAAVLERVQVEMVKLSRKDKAFCDEVERLKGRRDAEGLIKASRNFHEKPAAKALIQRAARLFAVKPKGAGPQVVKKPIAPGTAPAAKPAAQGWTRVNGQPTARQMDRSKTTADMILDNKAILNDGRKVTW